MAHASYAQLKKTTLLWRAWRAVRANAAKSSSIVTRSEALDFEKDADHHIRSISQFLTHKTFDFLPGTAIPISKGAGKVGIRPIIREPILNRIVKRALLEILKSDSNFSPFFNQPNSFGALPKKSVALAWANVIAARNLGFEHYIKSDIKAFFDSVPKDFIRSRIGALVIDSDLKVLLNKAISIELENLSEIDDVKFYFPLEDKGIAQGSSLSPLLANIALHEFDEIVPDENSITFRYVDDFLILSKTPRDASQAFKRAIKVLSSISLTAYNPDTDKEKASKGTMKAGVEFLGVEFKPGILIPSRKSRNKLREKVKEIFSEGRTALQKGGRKNFRRHSYTATLNYLSNVLTGWGNQYAFCNHPQSLAQLDQWVDEEIAKYWFWISEMLEGTDIRSRGAMRRRLVGVHLLSDSKSKPIIISNKEIAR